MSVINRVVVTTDSNGVSPTGFNKADSSTMFRKVASLFGAVAGGGSNGSMNLAHKPISALATVTTTATGDETDGDTLTVGNLAITFKSSAAAASSKQVNILAGTAGTSTSGASPALTATALSFYVNVNGDGPQLIYVDDASTHTGAAVAAAIQVAVRALVPFNALNAVAFSSMTCTYGSTYILTAGVKGLSTIVVTGAGAASLKLGVLNGGVEATGTLSTNNGIAALINGVALAGAFTGSSAAFNGIATAVAVGNVLTLTAGIPGTIGNGLDLEVSSTGTKMVLTHVWGAATAGTEGTAQVYKVGM